ncbi:MAG: hypothetical protein ACF8Q5_02515 [Phycisphaerales bacterium JB040]
MRNTAIAAALAVTGTAALANDVEVADGQTSVVLDFATLEAAASLAFSSVSGDVIAPGSLEGSVAFPINARDAAMLPTTFAYDYTDFLGTFSGTIEHTGSVLFNDDTVEVGNFTIGFDAGRVGTLEGAASGFFVESTTGVAAILFDIGAPSALSAGAFELVIGADLLVSPEFGGFLFDNGLSEANLAGAAVGSALVEAGTGCSGADFNDSGRVNFLDVLGFVRAFVSYDDGADVNADGMIDFADVVDFVNAYVGCRSFRFGH